MKLRKSPRTWRWRRRIAQDRPRRAARTYTSTSSRKSFRVGRSGWRLGRGVSRPLSSRFMKGDGIPLTPTSGPLLPRENVFARLDRPVAFHQVAIDAAQALRFGSYAAAGTILRIPGVQVDVHPARGLAHEALQKQGAEYGPGQGRCGDIVQIRHLAVELILIARPQRHGPQGVVFCGRRTSEVLHDALIVAEQGRQFRTQGNSCRA